MVDDIGGHSGHRPFLHPHLSVNYLIASAGILVDTLWREFLSGAQSWFYIFWGDYGYLFCRAASTLPLRELSQPSRFPLLITNGKYINRIARIFSVFPASDKESVVLSKMQINVLKSIESSSDRVISLQSLEDSLHGMVNYIILPLFAFAMWGALLTADHGGLEVGWLPGRCWRDYWRQAVAGI